MKHGRWLSGVMFAASLLLNTSVMAGNVTWIITDSCANTEEIRYRFFTDPPTWVWPSSDTYYVTKRLGESYRSTLNCPIGMKICYGAWQENGNVWGAGPYGSRFCEDCCTYCDRREHAMNLIC
jgi:hypothetical protein